MNEYITTELNNWLFMYDANTMTLITYPFEVIGVGQKVYYPSSLTAVCEPTEAEAEAEIKKLNLHDDRN